MASEAVIGLVWLKQLQIEYEQLNLTKLNWNRWNDFLKKIHKIIDCIIIIFFTQSNHKDKAFIDI